MSATKKHRMRTLPTICWGARFILTTLAALVSALPGMAQRVVYVDAAASGTNDGSSWANAFTSLQDAIAVAVSGDEVWVAAGIYHPDQGQNVTPGDREASFELKSGVALYGGFRGGETQREERDFEANETILSGDIADNDNDNVALDEPTRAENSYHVVVAGGGTDTAALLDGFAVTSGHANTDPVLGHSLGGGMRCYGEPVVRNVRFSMNTARSGAALDLGSSCSIMSTRFENNHAGFAGGAILCFRCDATVEDVSFRGNSAPSGGALRNDRGRLTLLKTVFIGNSASSSGGAIFNRRGEETLINVAFYGNAAYEGGALTSDEGTDQLVNVIFSGNAGDVGGAIFSNLNEGSLEAKNLTFANNTASVSGGAVHNMFGEPHYANTIFWGNDAPEGRQVFTERGSLRVYHSIMEGGLPAGVIDGGHNLATDPLFLHPLGDDEMAGTEDDDLRLRPDSPAIDAGDNSALPADTLDLNGDGNRSEPLPVDFAGRVRVFDGGRGGAVVDIGAHEFGAPAVRVGVQRPAEQPARSNLRLRVYPNPASAAATLVVNASTAARVEITLYDLLGRRVRVLHEGVLSGTGPQVLTVDLGGLAAGVYILLANAGGSANTAILHVP